MPTACMDAVLLQRSVTHAHVNLQYLAGAVFDGPGEDACLNAYTSSTTIGPTLGPRSSYSYRSYSNYRSYSSYRSHRGPERHCEHVYGLWWGELSAWTPARTPCGCTIMFGRVLRRVRQHLALFGWSVGMAHSFALHVGAHRHAHANKSTLRVFGFAVY